MACCVARCCSVPTGPATTICSSDKSCRCGVCLPSTCPHTIWQLEPTCCDNCPPPCHIPQPCVPTCFLLGSRHPTPDLLTVNLTTYVQPGCEEPLHPEVLLTWGALIWSPSWKERVNPGALAHTWQNLQLPYPDLEVGVE